MKMWDTRTTCEPFAHLYACARAQHLDAVSLYAIWWQKSALSSDGVLCSRAGCWSGWTCRTWGWVPARQISSSSIRCAFRPWAELVARQCFAMAPLRDRGSKHSPASPFHSSLQLVLRSDRRPGGFGGPIAPSCCGDRGSRPNGLWRCDCCHSTQHFA